VRRWARRPAATSRVVPMGDADMALGKQEGVTITSL
jgi:hypothetical protein